MGEPKAPTSFSARLCISLAAPAYPETRFVGAQKVCRRCAKEHIYFSTVSAIMEASRVI